MRICSASAERYVTYSMGEFDKCSTDLTCEYRAQEENNNNPPIEIMLSAILGIACGETCLFGLSLRLWRVRVHIFLNSIFWIQQRFYFKW